MPELTVTVQPSGHQKLFAVPEGGAPCDVVAAQLREEFGSGSLHVAGSNIALLPLADVRLQAPNYDYRIFAGAAGAAGAEAAGAAGSAEASAGATRATREGSGEYVYLDMALKDGKTDLAEVPLQHGRFSLRAAQKIVGIDFESSCYVSPVPLTPEQRRQIDWKASVVKSYSIAVEPGSYVYVKQRAGPNWLIKAFLGNSSNKI